jgi:hypothetical protein
MKRESACGESCKTVVFMFPRAAERQKHLFSLIRALRNGKNNRFR